MGVLVLRAWSDTASRGQYSILHDDGCATLIPIPDPSIPEPPCFLRAECLASPCTGEPLSRYIVRGSGVLHNDPRLDLGFLTDRPAPRGRIPRGLGPGDLVLFAAGLSRRPAQGPLLRRLLRVGEAGIYIVAGLLVREVVDVGGKGWPAAIREHPELAESPHYWRRPRDHPVALIGEAFTVKPPIPASKPRSPSQPSRELELLLGREIASKLARGRYRRTRLLPLEASTILSTMEELGYRILKPRPQQCTCKNTSPRAPGQQG